MKIYGITSDGGVTISGSLVVSGSITGSNGIVHALTASNAVTSSYALTASYASFDSSSLVTTTTFNTFTSSYSTGSFTGSFTGSLSGTASWSQNASTASYVLNSVSSSFASTASYVLQAVSASYATTASFALNTISASFATSASRAATSSLAITASHATSVSPLVQNVIVTGSLTVTNDFTVLGSASIQYITSSQLNIFDNIISVNTLTPSIRFGGLAVIDSGSSPQQSGSLLFDSQNNQWIFVHQSSGAVTSSLLLMGPQTFNNIGGETAITTNRLTKGAGVDLGEHLTDSNITDTGTLVSINSNTQVTGSLTTTAGITGSVFGTSSWAANAVTASYIVTAQTASYVLNAVSSSFATTASFATSASYAIVPSGPWGISNSSGVYTYYSSLSASIAASAAGQVIEMFADITATAVAPLKPNVTIQGNGHTYTYSGNTGDVFVTPASAAGTYNYFFENINISRANTATSTGAIFAGDGTGFTTLLNFKCKATRVTYTTTTGTAPIFRATGSFGIYGCSFDGIDVIGNTSDYLFDTAFAVNNIKNSRLENTGAGGCIVTPNISGNCFHENNYIKTVSGNGIFCNFAGDVIRSCTVISNSGNAIAGQSGATAYDCFAYSNTGRAYSGMTCFGCTGHTATGTVFYQSQLFGCTGRSATGYVAQPFSSGMIAYNSTLYSAGNIVCYDTAYVASFYNCSLRTDFNNVAGHAISIGTSGNGVFVNNYIQTANSASNCIKGTSAGISAKYTGNVFSGSLVPVNTNVTQTITTTQDNQGNILI